MRSMKLKKNKNFKIKKDEEILKIYFFFKTAVFKQVQIIRKKYFQEL